MLASRKALLHHLKQSMDRLETMRVFLTVAESGGFSATARRLGMSAPAVTRAIASLEARLGVQLLQRTTRVVRLTEAGRSFLPDCRRILSAVEEAEALAIGSHLEPRGQLTLTAPVTFGRIYVAPVVLGFLARYPEVSVRAVFLDRVVDMVEEGFDAAFRIGHLPDSSLTAIRIGSVRRVVCASAGYLAERGVPRRPQALAEHDAIALPIGNWGPEWAFASPRKRGSMREIATPRLRLTVNSVDVAIAAAIAGRGLVRLLSYQVAGETKAGRLKVVLSQFEPEPIPVHVVYPAGRRADAKLRAFVAYAVEHLRRPAF
jgi:DNA-binding transcriptional LysR family regulator